jgi:hypothetical protein
MSSERDPALERLFAGASRELDGAAFVAGVMARTNTLRTRRLIGVLAICIVAAPATWVVAGPFNDALVWLALVISQPVAPVGHDLPAPVVLPLNSVGGALVLAVFALRTVVKRLFP